MKLPTGIDPAADISSLRQLAAPWADEIRKAKARMAPSDFEWYRYDTLSNLDHLDRLLTGSNRRLLELIGKRPPTGPEMRRWRAFSALRPRWGAACSVWTMDRRITTKCEESGA